MSSPTMPWTKPGDTVTLNTPENPRLDGALATIDEVQDWGAHVLTLAAATGKFRALWEEMSPIQREPSQKCCDLCGSLNMIGPPSCLTCQDCGANSGCG